MKIKELIKSLQFELNKHGEQLKIDGDLGNKTLKALDKFEVHLWLTRMPDTKDSPGRDLTPAITMIKQFEGLYLKAYRDPIGIPTIGWGTIEYPNGMHVELGDEITIAKADEYLMYEVNNVSESVDEMVNTEISNNQFCALVSFAYNLGVGNLKGSTLLRKLNAREPKSYVADEFEKWINAAGQPLKGLIRRRNAEKLLFLS